ncbi:MAG TPA: transglutaminase-like domain-containing protein [Anaerolineales bacterium]|nr:transglutaminase-like domain-containing protein [Anaerolineales bacterium]
MTERVLRRILTADALGLLLAGAALYVLTYGVSASLRSTDTRYFFAVCLLAALLGFRLSRTELSGITASAAVAAVGLLGVWILGARLASPLLDLGRALLAVLPQVTPALESGTPIETAVIPEAWLVITQASSALAARVQTWLISLDGNVTVNDPLVRGMAWTLILWLISAWMGGFTGRRNPVASLLPAIALLAAVISYSEYKIETLWLLVFLLLLLMGIWNYRNHTWQWEKRKVDYSESIRYDTAQAVILLAIGLGVMAFIMPSISWREIRDFLRERDRASENRAADLLGVQQPAAPAGNIFVQQPSLPREHLLSGGYAQSQKIVMTIRTGELPPVPDPALIASPPPRYYWRSTTFDTYVGAGWVTSSAPPQTVEANTPLIPGLLDGYRLLQLDVQMMEPEGRLFWSGILFSTDIPFTANWRVRPGSSLFADRSALLAADLFAALSSTDSYKADAYIPAATVEELRAASTNYPEDIRERYLYLPRSVPPRVHHLARELTSGKDNAYDKARAIEAYLRTYPYDLEVPAPPPSRDVADYFLFDLKKGYCDYYATAMVVLSRSSGVPARFVSGYSSGSYDAPNAQYVVRELNAHSWVEVYFPEIGWVEFEPTAAQPEIERTLTEEILARGGQEESSASQLLYRFRLERALYWLSPLAGILVLAFFYFTFLEGWWLMRLAPEAAIERIYRRLYRLGRPLAGDRARAETAYEFMRKLVSRIDNLGNNSRFTNLFSSVRRDIEMLTALYQDSLFSNSHVEKNDSRKAWIAWRHARLWLWVARLIDSLNDVILSRNPSFRERAARNLKPYERDSSVAARGASSSE